MSSMFTKEVIGCKRELFICEMYYAEDNVEYTKTGIKTPRLQALPTMTDIKTPRLQALPTMTDIKTPRLQALPTMTDIKTPRLQALPTMTDIKTPRLQALPTMTDIKTPRLQASPTMNLPLKSHEDTNVERKLPAFRIVTTETDDVEGKEVFAYKDLDVLPRVQKCNWITEKWYTTYENTAVKLTFNIEPHIVPCLEVVIDEKLQFKIIVLGGCYQIVMHCMKTILDRYKQ